MKYILAVLVLLAGCRVQITVPPGGEVISESGRYRCAQGEVCTIEVKSTDFDEKFIAAADDNHIFTGWKKGEGYFCARSRRDCTLRTVGFEAYPGLMDLLGTDRVFYLEPVFKAARKFVVAGVIDTVSISRVDSDVNDENAAYVANDSPARAQAIPNPASVGGYANVKGAGEPGPSTESGDIDDFFEVRLLKGQVISLVVAEPQEGDLDLYIYNDNGLIVDFSVNTNYYERLTVAATGNYYVNVYAFSGASNYTLAIGRDQATAAAGAGMRADVDFVLDEALVQYRSPAITARNSGTKAEEVQRVSFAGVSAQAAGGSGKSAAKHSKSGQFASAELERKWGTLRQIKGLAARHDVAYAEPNFILRGTQTVPNDPYYSLQWHYRQINLPAAWDLTRGSRDVTVAVLDSGVLSGHPDLRNKLVDGYDFVRNPNQSLDGDGVDPNPYDPGDGVQAARFHGTHVAGTIAAATNNGNGVVGVGWNARVMPVRVLGKDNSGETYDVVQGIKYAAQLANSADTLPTRRADIINMSLGSPAYSQSMANAVRQARAAGVIVVAASGNDDVNTPYYPASYDGVVSVGAVDRSNTRAWYSNFGATLDLVAPGGDSSADVDGDGYADGIFSTGGEGEGNSVSSSYMSRQGTSMAAPHVAGVMALMKSVQPRLDPAAMDKLIRTGSITLDLGSPGRDNQYGYGIIDARKAVLAALQYQQAPTADSPLLSVIPRELLLAGDGSAVLVVSNAGSGRLQVSAVTAAAGWLAVSKLGQDPAGLGQYRVKVRPGTLGAGVYQTFVTVKSNAGTDQVPILVNVLPAGDVASAGVIYILLLDENGRNVYQSDIAPRGGRYFYRFDAVKEGTYTLLAGSDMDQDNLVCDAGESCGAYLTLSDTKPLVLKRNLTDLNFPVGYSSDIQVGSLALPRPDGPYQTRRKETTAEREAPTQSGLRRLH